MQSADFFVQIREEATKEAWSRGVELSRREAVSLESSSSEATILRVLDEKSGITARIHFFSEEAEWSKECACRIDPCHHVCAAIISWKRSQEEGALLPKMRESTALLVHSLYRDQGYLALERYIEKNAQRELLSHPLSSLTTGRVKVVGFTPSPSDLALESILGGERRGRLSRETLIKIIPYSKEVSFRLDEESITFHKEPIGIQLHLRNEGLGIFVQGKKDPRILETFSNGFVRTKDGLHPQADLNLDPEEKQMLVKGVSIPLRDLEKFASEQLPQWAARFPIVNEASNLPEFIEAPLSLDLHLSAKGLMMQVEASLVYGDPPLARIQEGVFRAIGQKVPIRDSKAERALREDFQRKTGLDLFRLHLLPTQEALKAVKAWQHLEVQRSGDGWRKFQSQGQAKPQLRWENGQLHLDLSLAIANTPVQTSLQAGEALQAWQKGESLVPLMGGGFAELPQDWLKQHGNLLLELLRAQEGRETLPKAFLPQMAELFEGSSQAIPEELKVFQRLKLFAFDEQEFQQDPRLKAELRGYQKLGVAFLEHARNLQLGALLADDMGLGKTVQTIAVLPSRTSLIIAPTSVLRNWQRELQRFRPDLKVALYHGPQRKWDAKADVILTSYGLVRAEEQRFQSQRWQMLVLDEAQTIKNHESKVAQSIYPIASDFRLALSGTPVENSLDDLWSLFHFLNPGLLGNSSEFKERYARPILEGATWASERLRHLVKPFLLRRLKKDVAQDLPPRIEKTLYVELSEEERLLYQAIQAQTREDILQQLASGHSVMEALEALLRLRQACCHPQLLPQRQQGESSKLKVLMASLLVAIAEGHKALIFSQWTGFLDLLEPVLREAGLDFLRIDGQTKQRQELVDAFQNPLGPKIMIMSLKAGGVGLNLTAADHVYILDPWWNPAAQDQAADRAHRIGQTRTVMIHPLVALDSVEEKILELQHKKRSLAEAAIGEGTLIPHLSKDDLLALLQD